MAKTERKQKRLKQEEEEEEEERERNPGLNLVSHGRDFVLLD